MEDESIKKVIMTYIQYDSTFSRTVWRLLYGGAKGLVVWYHKVGVGMLSEYTAGSLLDACGVQPGPTRYPCAAGIRSNLRSNLC
jgi:hypothetical protein